MRNKLLALFAVKALIISVWLFGWDGFKANMVFAEPSAAQTHAAKTAEVQKPEDREKGMLAALNRREEELNAREAELDAKEERLSIVKQDIEARLVEVKKVHEGIEAQVKKINEINDERIKKIVKIYGSMAPEEAASRIEKLDEEMAVMIIASMSEKKAAKILGLVDIGKSVKLSKSLKVKQ